LQRLALYVRHNRNANLAKLAVIDTLQNGLVHQWAAPLNAHASFGVHVRYFAADKAFIRFYLTSGTADLAASESLFSQSFPDAVKHKPCRLLRDAKRPRQFVREHV